MLSAEDHLLGFQVLLETRRRISDYDPQTHLFCAVQNGDLAMISILIGLQKKRTNDVQHVPFFHRFRRLKLILCSFF